MNNVKFDWTGDLSKDVENMMETFFGPGAFKDFKQQHGTIAKFANGLRTITFSVPGCQKSDFQIKLEGNQLFVTLVKGCKFTPAFAESYIIESHDDAANISASCENGILIVNVPSVAKPEAQVRTIPIA